MFTFKDKQTDEKLNPHLSHNHPPPPLPKFSLESAVTSATLPVLMVKMPGRAAGPQLPQTRVWKTETEHQNHYSWWCL